MRPQQEPIGLEVSRTGRLLHRAFDRQWRAGFTAADLGVLRGVLGRLRTNVSAAAAGD